MVLQQQLGAPAQGPCYLLLLGVAGPLLLAVLVLGSESVRVLRHVLRLLHKLRRLHALHGDDVEGVQILDVREGKTEYKALYQLLLALFVFDDKLLDFVVTLATLFPVQTDGEFMLKVNWNLFRATVTFQNLLILNRLSSLCVFTLLGSVDQQRLYIFWNHVLKSA